MSFILLSSLREYIDEPVFEDLGGKTEECDKSIKQTALRECKEETNDTLVFDEEKLTDVYYYDERSKYVCYFVKVKLHDIDISECNYLEWINVVNLKYIKLHPRLEWLTYNLFILPDQPSKRFKGKK